MRKSARGGDQIRRPGRSRMFVACAALIMTACTHGGPGPSGVPLNGIRHWWILIGHSEQLSSIDWSVAARGAELVVLSDDPRIRLGELPYGTLRLGYLSICEADVTRAFWREVRDRSFIIEPNPDWNGIVRVDVRDKRWQELVLGQEAPRLIQGGFHGFMLDTIDVAPYLEAREPARFAGSKQALREFAALLRAAFPHAVILANGMSGLAEVAPWVDGYVTEGVFATYDFVTQSYRKTTEREQKWKLGQIERARKVADRPVFAVEYADPPQSELGLWAGAQARAQGFKPYVTVKDINVVPAPPPAPATPQ